MMSYTPNTQENSLIHHSLNLFVSLNNPYIVPYNGAKIFPQSAFLTQHYDIFHQ